jgi:hypothetical protein
MAGVFVAIKEFIELGFDASKCGAFLVEFFKSLMHFFNQQGQWISGFMTASPVYPLAIDEAGRRTGFLADGTIVQEIPGAHAVGLGEERLILLPGEATAQLAVSGYDSGRSDIYAALAQPGGGDLLLTYAAIPTEAGTEMRLDAWAEAPALRVTTAGVTEERLPDEIRLTTVDGQSQLLPIPALPDQSAASTSLPGASTPPARVLPRGATAGLVGLTVLCLGGLGLAAGLALAWTRRGR